MLSLSSMDRGPSGDPRPYTAQFSELLGDQFDEALIHDFIRKSTMPGLRSVGEDIVTLRAQLAAAEDDSAKERLRTQYITDLRESLKN